MKGFRPHVLKALETPDVPTTWRAGKSGGLRTAPPIRERLYGDVIKRDSGCWVKASYPDPERRVIISIAGDAVSASRVVYFLANGEQPEVVRHTCDNPPCINPDHLIGGTPAQNTQDMMERGRAKFAPRKTHCKRGHELKDPNLYYSKNGRACRQCAVDRSKGLLG